MVSFLILSEIYYLMN